MKKLTLGLIATLALGANVFAQGLVSFDNVNGPGGLVYATDGVTPYNSQFTVALYGGSSAGDLTLLGTLTSPSDFQGIFYGGFDVAVPGVALGDVATLQLLAFAGPTAYSTVLQGLQAGFESGISSIWTQATGGTGAPPTPGTFLLNPSVTLQPVPEPTTFALAGLGIASMLIFRRRKA